MKGRTAIKIFAAGLLVPALFLSGCANAETNAKTLKVGMECAYAPFNWTQTDDSNGAVKLDSTSYAGGYDVEIAKRVASGLELDLQIVKTEWEGLLPALTSGKIDLIVAGMSPTAERKETIDFTESYYTSDLVIVVMKDGAYASAKGLGDFGGAKITGQLNTFHYTVIDQLSGVDKQTAMDDFPTMLTSLVSGRIDGYISERPGAMAAAASDDRVTFVSFEQGSGFEADPEDVTVAIGVKKDSEITGKINDLLARIPESERQSLMDAAIVNQPLE